MQLEKQKFINIRFVTLFPLKKNIEKCYYSYLCTVHGIAICPCDHVMTYHVQFPLRARVVKRTGPTSVLKRGLMLKLSN